MFEEQNTNEKHMKIRKNRDEPQQSPPGHPPASSDGTVPVDTDGASNSCSGARSIQSEEISCRRRGERRVTWQKKETPFTICRQRLLQHGLAVFLDFGICHPSSLDPSTYYSLLSIGSFGFFCTSGVKQIQGKRKREEEERPEGQRKQQSTHKKLEHSCTK